MIYTRVLLDDAEMDLVVEALKNVPGMHPDGDRIQRLLNQLEYAWKQTQRIRENERAGVK